MKYINSITLILGLIYNVNAGSLLNPDFEEGLVGWELEGSSIAGTWTLDSSIVNSGDYSLKANNWPKWFGQSFTPTQVSDIANLSFYAYNNNTSQTRASLLYSDNTKTDVYFTNALNTWEYRNLTPNLVHNKVLVEMSVISWNQVASPTNATFYDTFNFQSVPEPSSNSLLFIGLLSIVGFRRRLTII